MAQKVLIADDDQVVHEALGIYLKAEGFEVVDAFDGTSALESITPEVVLCVLDIMMPKMSGIEVCREIRKTSQLPILMLTAKGEEIDRILGLEMGADDYLVKPFNPRELLARIRAVLRRAGGVSAPEVGDSTMFAFAGWKLDKAVRRLFNPAGERVALTGAELDLLLAFCERPRRVLSRDQLLDLTQGRTAAPFERSIDVLVSRLRQKMERNPREPELIQTIRSGGYMFSPEIEASPEIRILSENQGG